MTTSHLKNSTRDLNAICIFFRSVVLYTMLAYQHTVYTYILYTCSVHILVVYIQQSRVISIYSQSIIIVYRINHRTFFLAMTTRRRRRRIVFVDIRAHSSRSSPGAGTQHRQRHNAASAAKTWAIPYYYY